MPRAVRAPTVLYETGVRAVTGASDRTRVPVRIAALAAIAVAAVTFSLGTRFQTDPAPTPAQTVLSPGGLGPTPSPLVASTRRPYTPAGGISAAEALATVASQLPADQTDIEGVRLVRFRDTGLFGAVEADRWVWLVTASSAAPGSTAGTQVRLLERFAIDQWTGELLASGFQMSP